MWRSIIAGVALACTGAAAHPEEPRLPEWMSGCWEQVQGEHWTEECWMRPRGGIMLGASRSGKGGRLGEWESMQIVLDQPNEAGATIRMAFWAAGGTNRTLFAWSPGEAPGVSFHNSAHDYPQRIRYWREGADLMAEIAMEDGSRAMRWRYRRVR